MATTTPFAYNIGSTISGTTQIGSLAVGTTGQDYSISPGGVPWWMGPDQDLGYVIAKPISGNTQPTQLENRIYLSPTYKAFGIDLSNNNQTASQTLGPLSSVLGINGISDTEKVMFSVRFDTENPAPGFSGRFIGIGKIDMNYDSYPGNDNVSFGFNDDGKFYHQGNVFQSGLPIWKSGDIIDIALNNIDGYIWIRVNGGNWNNSITANPSTNSGGVLTNTGTLYPVLCPYVYGNMSIQNKSKYSVPTGFLFLGNTLASVGFNRSDLTDISFINLTNGLFNQSFTSATDASTWLTTNGYWNSYSNSVVTTNLQLYLDAGNPSSYSGTGNVWYDLSGNGNDVTMQNSGNITWDNSGFFTLTSNGYFNNTSTTNLPIGSSPYTLSVWVQFGSSWGGQGMIGISSTYGGGNSVNAFRTAGTNNILNYWWGNDFSVSFSPPSSTDWFNFVAKWDGTNRSIWVNGVQIGTQTASGLNVSNGVLNIGNTNNGEYLNGNIGQALIYDRALSLEEIEDNFNNTKSTYGY